MTGVGFRLPSEAVALLEVERLSASDGTVTIVCWMDPLSVWRIVEMHQDGRAWDTGALAPRDLLPEAVTAALEYADEKQRFLAGLARDPRGRAAELVGYVLPPEHLCHRLPAQGSLF